VRENDLAVVNASRALVSCVLLGVVLLVAGCGGSYSASPGEVVEGYEQALAEGGYVGACGFLTPPTAAAMARRASVSSCSAAVARCLPVNAIIPKKDQSQLLYANVSASTHRSTAEVTISGNPVADAIKKVSLVQRPGGWKLTSPGAGLAACQRRHQRRRRQHHKR
jgi:hypothetical protein